MTLYPKLLALIIPVALISSLSIISYSKTATHTALVSGLEDGVLGARGRWNDAVAAGLAARDERALLPVLQAYQRDHAGAYALVTDDEGRIVGHTNVALVGQVRRDPLDVETLSASKPLTRETRVKDEPILDVAFPVVAAAKERSGEDFLLSGTEKNNRASLLGVLRIGLPLGETLATERRITGHIVFIVVLASVAAVLAIFTALRGILEPIRLLAAATLAIRAGDYGGHVPAGDGGEIGDLARSFNEMSSTLARTTVSKNYFNDILQNIQDPLIVTDPGGAIRLVNPSLQALTAEDDGLIGRQASTLFDDQASPFRGLAAKTLQAEGKLHNMSALLIGPEQERLPVLLSVSVLKTANGGDAGLILAAKDMRDVKKLEARMHQSEKLSAVGQLAAGVAHEINNPLGVILGFAQGLARQVAPGHDLELPVRSIEREALRCKALVQNLLTFARTSEADRRVMELNAAIELALPLIEAQAKICRANVQVELARGLPMILGNMSQLQQVVLNLAKNALDAMPTAGTLTIATELVESTPHSWVRLRVTDTGTGIAPANMSKIFEPFFTTKPVGQGTGLGLSLINEIVQKHSGTIEVESRPGRTEFSVKLPVRTGREMGERLKLLQTEKLSAAPTVAYHKR
ncbi:MAG: HAMP domain-containing protein [Elusimicrobia bacterium]|nr:HAMP domain-containing protein [Elusimicrobiota bacterium]